MLMQANWNLFLNPAELQNKAMSIIIFSFLSHVSGLEIKKVVKNSRQTQIFSHQIAKSNTVGSCSKVFKITSRKLIQKRTEVET